MSRVLVSAGLGALAVILATLPASAARYVCDVRSTPDGFVALRANPAERSTLLARIRPGQMVLLGDQTSGDWRQVTYWANGQVPPETGSAAPQSRRGWVHGQLLGDCG